MSILNKKHLNITEIGFNTYGLSINDLNEVRKKHEKNINYLKNHYFVTSNGQVKSYYDVNISANYSPRYFPELLNRIDTLDCHMLGFYSESDYVSVMLTITLEGFFRDFVEGNFNNPYFLKNKDYHLKFIPNDDIYGYLRDKIENKEAFTIKDCQNCLNYQIKRFNQSYFRKKLRKKGFVFPAIRVNEPHKDGVPHSHILAYVPKQYLEDFKREFVRCFPARQNIRPSKKSTNAGDLEGFRTDIKNARGYVLKYILKSFLDLKENKKLDFIQAWYIKHRIPRLTMTRTICPLWVYRKMLPLEKDYKMLDYKFKMGYSEISKENDYIFIENDGMALEYNNGVYTSYFNGRILKRFGAEKEKDKKIPDLIKLNYKKRIKTPKIIVDGVEYVQKNDILVKKEILKPVSKYSDFHLISHYNKIKNDLNNINIDHFYVVEKEIVKRDLY